MVVSILWSNEAQKTFDKNISYLEKEWSEREIINFIAQANIVIKAIASDPERFSPSAKSKKVRKATINKYIILYYQYDPAAHQVILLTFWHSKQDPKKLKY